MHVNEAATALRSAALQSRTLYEAMLQRFAKRDHPERPRAEARVRTRDGGGLLVRCGR